MYRYFRYLKITFHFATQPYKLRKTLFGPSFVFFIFWHHLPFSLNISIANCINLYSFTKFFFNMKAIVYLPAITVCIPLFFLSCNKYADENKPVVLNNKNELDGGGTYSLIKKIRPGEKIVIEIPEGVADRTEEETCNCKAKVTNASPAQGGFYVWAVGVYHSLPSFNCNFAGPVGLLWNQGDEYDFIICKQDRRIYLEFAVSPPLNPSQQVPVSVTVRLSCNNGIYEYLEGVIYHTFTAESGETVEDRRAYFGVTENCIAFPR